jgi:hypothetical protein
MAISNAMVIRKKAFAEMRGDADMKGLCNEGTLYRLWTFYKLYKGAIEIGSYIGNGL